MLVLNCGCGDTPWGDVRIDMYPSPTSNILGDLEQGLPFKAESFDEVLCLNILEHMGNPLNLIREIERVLKPGGLLRLRTDNASYWRYHLNANLARKLGLGCALAHSGGYEQTEAHGPEDRHYSLFTFHHLRNLLRDARLDIKWLDHWPRDMRPTPLVRILPFLKPYICSFLSVEARKPQRAFSSKRD